MTPKKGVKKPGVRNVNYFHPLMKINMNLCLILFMVLVFTISKNKIMKAKVNEIKLIDKSVLETEIKRRIDDELKIINKFTHSFYKYEITRCNARIALLKQLQEFLDTLEVKKVSLKTFPEPQESEDEQFKDQFKSDIAWLEKQGHVKESQDSQCSSKSCKENGGTSTNEDEWIRNTQLNYWRSVGGKEWHGVPVQETIAWLEKQGSQKPENKCPKFYFDDVLALQCCMETVKKVQEDEGLYKQLQRLHDRLHDAYWLEKQGKMQKWTEEDESVLQGIWDEILANKHEAKEYDWKTYDRYLSWLDNIKQRLGGEE